jgi:hypothetical protein
VHQHLYVSEEVVGGSVLFHPFFEFMYEGFDGLGMVVEGDNVLLLLSV